MINYHTANGRDTTKMEARIKKHLTPFFAGRRMADISVPVINAYIVKRKGARNGTISGGPLQTQTCSNTWTSPSDARKRTALRRRSFWPGVLLRSRSIRSWRRSQCPC